MARKKSTQTKKPAHSGAVGDWLAWLATADPKDRETLRREVESVAETEYEGIAALGKMMIKGLISGAVSPSVSEEARGWAEIMLAAQATNLALTQTNGDSSTSIILALGDLQKQGSREIEAHYTIDGEVETEKMEFERLLAGNDK